ncbi:hypothetical protein BST99_05245 [Aureicoccus marinus]|uniref:Uncharacterized protein n=1 Tax=Aureicoccus marinus TaxID=754435 RepID=A0A2S7T5M1_9FLAO|nr:hypothetical protein BST99_05245 [Aureicoccus marinus]
MMSKDAILLEKVVTFGLDNVNLENTNGVVRMVLELYNSGAVEDILFECEVKDGIKCRKRSTKRKTRPLVEMVVKIKKSS